MATKKIKKAFKLAPIVIIITVFLVLLVFAFSFLKNSYFFKIQEVICPDKEKMLKLNKVLDLKNKNIFSVDLDVISQKLREGYPEFSDITASRLFPNKIKINFRKRIPVAKFKLSGRFFYIDDEAVILTYSSIYDNLDLIILDGLNISFKELKSGQRIRSKNVSFALSLVKQINNFLSLKPYKVSRLDISKLNKISLFIIYEIEVIMMKGDFKEKLNILILLLKQLGPELNQIRYVDLRFKDPVIKKR